MKCCPSLCQKRLASRRQTIIFSSDDSRSLHIIVCYYRWGRNRCWAIRSQFGGKQRKIGLRSCICDCGSKHVHAWLKANKKYTLLFLQVYGRHTERPVDPSIQSKG